VQGDKHGTGRSYNHVRTQKKLGQEAAFRSFIYFKSCLKKNTLKLNYVPCWTGEWFIYDQQNYYMAISVGGNKSGGRVFFLCHTGAQYAVGKLLMGK